MARLRPPSVVLTWRGVFVEPRGPTELPCARRVLGRCVLALPAYSLSSAQLLERKSPVKPKPGQSCRNLPQLGRQGGQRQFCIAAVSRWKGSAHKNDTDQKRESARVTGASGTDSFGWIEAAQALEAGHLATVTASSQEAPQVSRTLASQFLVMPSAASATVAFAQGARARAFHHNLLPQCSWPPLSSVLSPELPCWQPW